MSVDDSVMKVLKREVEFLKDDIITAYDEKGMRASGNFARSLNVVRRLFTVELYGVHYSRYLETGRKAGGMPPVERIRDWIIQKKDFYIHMKETDVVIYLYRGEIHMTEFVKCLQISFSRFLRKPTQCHFDCSGCGMEKSQSSK